MNTELEVKVPFFTDFTRSEYLRKTLNEIGENDVIAIEFYHEFKDLLLDFLNKKLNYEKLSLDYKNKMRFLDPELIKKEPNHKIAPTFEYIIKSLSNKKYLALETLEDYDYGVRSLEQRNKVIYSNLGMVINKYINQAENVVLFTAMGHSTPLLMNMSEKNNLNINNYVKYKFKKINKIENEKQSFIISYSRSLQ
jgi:hypothetical protein